MNSNKEKYSVFCQKIYVPIYSKPWWMDAVCGPTNWDVWLYEKGGQILAALPYYLEQRGSYLYITKAPLTQNNGLQIWYPEGQRAVARQAYEEEIIEKVNEYIQSLGIDVYEQQYRQDFLNWLPFFWNGYTAIPRYSYVIEDTCSVENACAGFSKNYRNKLKNAQKRVSAVRELSAEEFWPYHLRVYSRQGLESPFPKEVFLRMDDACRKHGCCCAMGAVNAQGEISSIIYLVWDERSMYRLMGGYMAEYASDESYVILTHRGIEMAVQKQLNFDFEGSVIHRINRSVREYGGKQNQYFRIRKVFNPDIIRAEAEEQIARLAASTQKGTRGG